MKKLLSLTILICFLFIGQIHAQSSISLLMEKFSATVEFSTKVVHSKMVIDNIRGERTTYKKSLEAEVVKLEELKSHLSNVAVDDAALNTSIKDVLEIAESSLNGNKSVENLTHEAAQLLEEFDLFYEQIVHNDDLSASYRINKVFFEQYYYSKRQYLLAVNLSMMLTNETEFKQAPKYSVLGLILEFEQNIGVLLNNPLLDETAEEYISTVLSEWTMVEPILTQRGTTLSTVNKKKVLSFVSSLAELNSSGEEALLQMLENNVTVDNE